MPRLFCVAGCGASLTLQVHCSPVTAQDEFASLSNSSLQTQFEESQQLSPDKQLQARDLSLRVIEQHVKNRKVVQDSIRNVMTCYEDAGGLEQGIRELMARAPKFVAAGRDQRLLPQTGVSRSSSGGDGAIARIPQISRCFRT